MCPVDPVPQDHQLYQSVQHKRVCRWETTAGLSRDTGSTRGRHPRIRKDLSQYMQQSAGSHRPRPRNRPSPGRPRLVLPPPRPDPRPVWQRPALSLYPKIEPEHQYDAASDLRCGAHSDYGTVTLLFQLQGQPGLEILQDSQTWSAVPVNPTAEPEVPILVNIGDLLSSWTNGYLKSAVHRVIAADSSAPERYSIAYFCHPLDDAKLDPVPSTIVQGHQPEVRNGGVVITAREHLEARLRATYT